MKIELGQSSVFVFSSQFVALDLDIIFVYEI